MSETEKTPEPSEAQHLEPAPTGADDRVVATPTTRRPAAVLAAIFGLAVVVVLLDQLSKMWAQSALTVGEPPKPLIGELIQLRLIYNPGAALSLASGMTWVLTLLSVGVVVFIVLMARKIGSRAWAVALGLVLGGAIGNLLDRLFRAPGFPNGHVVDFIDYGPFIGNVADIAIVVAAALIAILAFVGIGPDGRAADAADAPTPRHAGSDPDGTPDGGPGLPTTTATPAAPVSSSAEPETDKS